MALGVASRVALVTGSTSGVGYGIARALAAKGHTIILSGLGDASLIQHCQDHIKRDFDVPVYHVSADLTNECEIHKMCSTINKKHSPGIDILVNNAGWGRIINIASAHATVASENKAGYCAAKHGLVGLTKVTALDTAGSGVTCNTINPGWVGTEIFWQQVQALAEKDGISEDDAKFKILEKHPTKELTTVEQIGEAVNFLCSPAGDNMTGTSFVLDGGWTAT